MQTVFFKIIFLSLLSGVLFAQSGAAIQIAVKGLSCPFCVYGIEKRLNKVPGVVTVKTNYKQSRISVEKEKKTKFNLDSFLRAVQEAGFSVDHIQLTLQGTLTTWEGQLAIQEKDSGQLFILVEAGKNHLEETLSQAKIRDLKKLSKDGKNKIVVQGPAHSHVDAPAAIAVTKYWQAP